MRSPRGQARRLASTRSRASEPTSVIACWPLRVSCRQRRLTYEIDESLERDERPRRTVVELVAHLVDALFEKEKVEERANGIARTRKNVWLACPVDYPEPA